MRKQKHVMKKHKDSMTLSSKGKNHRNATEHTIQKLTKKLNAGESTKAIHE